MYYLVFQYQVEKILKSQLIMNYVVGVFLRNFPKVDYVTSTVFCVRAFRS